MTRVLNEILGLGNPICRDADKGIKTRQGDGMLNPNSCYDMHSNLHECYCCHKFWTTK